MCLEIVAAISPEARAHISAARLSGICGLKVLSRKFEGSSCLHFTVTGGCSCEFLSDAAEFKCETWTLDPVHLQRLAQAIDALCDECKSFFFVAHWLGGDRERRSEKISATALAKLVAENQIGNNVLYVVG